MLKVCTKNKLKTVMNIKRADSILNHKIQLTPCRKRANFFYSNWLFSLGLQYATMEASRFLRTLVFCEAVIITLQENE